MMNNYFLCVNQPDKGNYSLNITDLNPNLKKSNCRTSPIFLVSEKPSLSKDQIVNIKNGFLIFLYSPTPYSFIANNKYFFQKNEILVFITHGNASICLYSKNKIKPELETLIFQDMSYETWNLTDNFIVVDRKKIPSASDELFLDLDIEELSYEDKVNFKELIPSINFLRSNAQTYNKEYLYFVDEFKKGIIDLYSITRFLEGLDNEKEFKEKIINNNDDSVETIENLNIITSIKKSSENKILATQIRDEVIQLSAVIKTVNNQAFFGIDILGAGFYRTGSHSLLGIGNSFYCINSLYYFVSSKFSKLDLKSLSNNFNKYACPEQLDKPSSYENWISEIKENGDYPSINDLFNRKLKVIDNHHLVFFSNRLGYRETKRSISFAKQSLFLSFLPPWGFGTFTHEFLHSHVRRILAKLYPLDDINGNELSDDFYLKYSKQYNNPKEIKFLFDFLRITICNTVQKLLCSVHTSHNNGTIEYSVTDVLPKETLKSALIEFYKPINEIIVHVLDFHYFYNSKVDLYIKTIWSSWLTLPVSISRIPEYILRTICAISTKQPSGELESIFEWAYEKIKCQLEVLSKCDYIDSNQVKYILKVIKKQNLKDELEIKYVSIWAPFVDLTRRFLYSQDLKKELLRDTELEPSENGFEYNIEYGSFEDIKIESPISFLNYNYSNTLMFDTELSYEEVEYYSLWLSNIIASYKRN